MDDDDVIDVYPIPPRDTGSERLERMVTTLRGVDRLGGVIGNPDLGERVMPWALIGLGAWLLWQSSKRGQ
jgi:hypothetical protein